MNKSINIKEEILEYSRCDGYRCPHEISEDHYIVTKDDLDRMEREVREETIKETDANWYMEIKSKAISKSPYGLSPNDIDEIFDKYGIQESEEKA